MVHVCYNYRLFICNVVFSGPSRKSEKQLRDVGRLTFEKMVYACFVLLLFIIHVCFHLEIWGDSQTKKGQTRNLKNLEDSQSKKKSD